MKRKYVNITTSILMVSMSISLSNCGGETNKKDASEGVKEEISKIDEKIEKETTTPPENVTLKVGGKFFTIPSPIQTAFLIKEEGAGFNSELLNNSENGETYTTSFKKALNMGVYGADMGYITLYENTDLSLKYLKTVRKIADELDLSGAFNEKLAERFSENMNNQDSMLVFVNEAYKNADDYLKNNDKSNIAALVVVGGWVEAVYFASQSAIESNNKKIINRVAEQKQALVNQIAMLKSLESFAKVEEYEDLILDLEGLLAHFNEIKFNYEYVEPLTDASNKVTKINSKNQVEISEETFKKISETIKDIRNSIIG